MLRQPVRLRLEMGQVKVPGMRASAVGCEANPGWSQGYLGLFPLSFQVGQPILNKACISPKSLLQGEESGFQLTLEEGEPHLSQ